MIVARRTPPSGALLVALILTLVAGRAAVASAEVRLDRDYLSGIIEKMPPCPFGKAGQYRGTAHAYRLAGIDAAARRFLVSCRIEGEFRPPVGGNLLNRARNDAPESGHWKAFSFDVKASVNVEPGAQGVPRFRVDVEEVKRRELDGVAGVLAKILGTYFDQMVTQFAAGKASLLSQRLNAQVLKRLATFQEYGVFCGIDYAPTQVVLHFDLTRLRSEGVAGYVFPAPREGAVPLYRWAHRRLGTHFYGTVAAPPNPALFQAEGVACYVFAGPSPGAVPLERWHSRRDYFYTTVSGGVGAGGQGYRREGVACYVYPEPKPGTVPLYRFVDPRTGDHFYTLHPHAEFAK